MSIDKVIFIITFVMSTNEKYIMSTNRTSAPNNLSEDDYKRIAKEFADTWYKFIEPKNLDVLIIDRFCNDSIVYVFIDTKFRKLDYYNSL